MQAFKCKICGGDLQVDRITGIAVCEYCGTKQVLPLFSDDSSKRLYESGNNYLQHGEYDKAETVFNQLLSINPQDAEIYWDLVLCKYGITFVLDPQTGKYIPTCNRTHYESVFNDKNYQNAVRYSDEEKSAFYKENAEIIDNIQKGILSVSKKEKPYDIFISYKETNADGTRTKDSVVAQELYEKLTHTGYKVFFSRITLEDKIGSQYEPYIYAALSSSKVMLTICSSRENIEAPWVKNEWSRFLNLRQKDATKTLILLYFSMPKDELPEEFAIFSSQDIGKENYEQDLIRGIKKLIPLPIILKEKRKKQRKALGIVAACFCVAAVVLTAVLMPTYIKYNKYTDAMKLFENSEYAQAMTEFQNLCDFKDSKEMVEKCIKQPDYDAALQLYYDGNYAEATWAFDELGNYEDAAKQKEQAELSWRKSLATVITGDLDVYSNTCYVINKNGTVDGIDGAVPANLSIEEHGKIVSITPSAETLYALHEDGYVSNAKENNNLSDDSEWHNIVKISRQLYNTNIALRADGTMLYGNTGSDEFGQSDNWIKEISEWTDIVDFELYFEGTEFSNEIGAIIGIKADGTLCAVYNDDNYIRQQYILDDSLGATIGSFTSEKLQEILSQFNNVKTLFFQINTYEAYSSADGNTAPVDVVALTKDGKLQNYKNGIFAETDANDVCSVFAPEYQLKENGDLEKISDQKIVLHDIAHVDSVGSIFAITRTGQVYQCEYLDWHSMDCISQTYDEWLSRLD